MGLMRCFSLLLLCALLASVRADRSASLPSLANSLLNAADDILDTEKDQHTGRRTFLSSIIHAAVPGAHRFRPARDEYRPVRPTAVPSAEREAHLRVARAANSGGCGIGYRPNGTANVCTANACTITQLACGASQVDPASYTGDLSVCTVLQVTCANAYTRDLSAAGCSPITMVCNDTVVSATPPATAACSVNTLLCLNPAATLLDFTPSSAPKCSVDELSCNGTLTATPYTDGDGNCSVTRRACATNEDFTVIVSSCLGNGTCTYNSYAAEDPCFIPDTNVPCKCPLDRIGSSCDTGRPFTCAFELLSPQPDCKPLLGTGNAPLDGDPPCFTRWKRDEEIQWEYNVRCAFLNTTGLDSYVDDPRFQYFVRVGNTFAISAPTGNTPLVEARFKIFNFNILSDNNASIVVPLNAPQLSGQNPVQFDLLLANVPDKYYAGGRLYFEAGITSNLAGIRKRFDRRFIDPPDAPRVKRTDGGLSGGAIAGIIIACLAGLALIGGGVYLWLRRKRRNEKRLRKAMMQQPR